MADLHKHILVTGYTEFNPTENFVDNLNDWFYRLVDKVNMKIHIDPVSKYCYDEGNEGLSGLVCITTSHASIHFWPSYFKADLYSCSDFTKEQVFEMLEEFFPTKLTYTLIDRTDDSHPIIESGEIHY